MVVLCPSVPEVAVRVRLLVDVEVVRDESQVVHARGALRLARLGSGGCGCLRLGASPVRRGRRGRLARIDLQALHSTGGAGHVRVRAPRSTRHPTPPRPTPPARV